MGNVYYFYFTLVFVILLCLEIFHNVVVVYIYIYSSFRHYTCPVCSISMVNMKPVWEKLDEEVAATAMPTEYADLKVDILCRDCHKVRIFLRVDESYCHFVLAIAKGVSFFRNH